MKFFLDTEFIEDGKTIDLIAIAIVAEDGSYYYAVSQDFEASKAGDWVIENVLPQLPPIPYELKDQSNLFSNGWQPRILNSNQADSTPKELSDLLCWKSKEVIALEVVKFIKGKCVDSSKFSLAKINEFLNEKEKLWALKLDSKPEVWSYYADYAWVVFCQLFGTMMDLPYGFPLYCRDIKQECDRLGNPNLPKQETGEHNALVNAHWNMRALKCLEEYEKTQSRQPV